MAAAIMIAPAVSIFSMVSPPKYFGFLFLLSHSVSEAYMLCSNNGERRIWDGVKI